ncbi:MAG: NAD(P)/FAD-dependent oxidoreductase [Clostridia bacterium]|nr:NAD(P)/FAD-dependent oxidoreductase [Clostridia bacterium]
MKKKSYDVAIIGAGVVGAMIARKLSEYKLNVCILEKEADVAMGATKANSAIIHAGFDAAEGTLKAKLNVKGSEMMPQIARELGVKYQNNGSLVLGFHEEDRTTLSMLLDRGIRNGVRGLRIIEQAELQRLEPNLSDRAICALEAPSGAIICPYELTVAAIGNAMDNGASLLCDFEVTAIHNSDNFYELCSPNHSIKAKYIVNAAGLYADRIAAMVGDTSFQIHPRRGEYLLLDKECGNLVRHTVFRTPTNMGKGILITPTVDGNLLLGPTSENSEEKENKATTASGLVKILKEAGENLKSLPLNKMITSFCGLRAAGSSGDFIINSPKDRFINVAGIESPGLSASPAIAVYVTELLAKQRLPLEPKQNFNPFRRPMHAFHEMSIQEKNELIKKDPSYGRIVCRCEGISEGEILDAIRTNPKATDLDGVKRRTRAQMGRCQGGFCTPYVMELIARETGIPYERVTKFGGGSYINVAKTKGEN